MKKLSWFLLTLFLFFLPFQGFAQNNLRLPRGFFWMDEVFVIFCAGLFLFGITRGHGVKKETVRVLSPMLLLGAVGIVSGFYNANRTVVTFNGIFDYVKAFIVIPVFCLFSVDGKMMGGLYMLLRRLALFLCFIAIAQELFYFAGLPVENVWVAFKDIRFGLMRTPSLMGHPNVFGFYALLFFVMDFALYKRVRWQNLILAAGVLLSVSRMVWIAFFSVLALFFLRREGKKVALLLAFVLVIISLTVPNIYSHTMREMNSPGYFREYVMFKSLKIWREQPVLGLGPGMYGGVVSFMFDSPVYGRYCFSRHWLDVMKKILSLDQFWPQLLVEMGLLGMISFILILLVLWYTAKKMSLNCRPYFLRNMFSGFAMIPFVLAVYLLGSGLNQGAFLITYGVLFGMALGVRHENLKDQ
jgi:hypothetical protein